MVLWSGVGEILPRLMGGSTGKGTKTSHSLAYFVDCVLAPRPSLSATLCQKCSVPRPGAGSCSPPLLWRGTATALLLSAPHAATAHGTDVQPLGRTNTNRGCRGEHVYSVGNIPRSTLGKAAATGNCFASPGTTEGSGSSAVGLRGLSPVFLAQILRSKCPTAAMGHPVPKHGCCLSLRQHPRVTRLPPDPRAVTSPEGSEGPAGLGLCCCAGVSALPARGCTPRGAELGWSLGVLTLTAPGGTSLQPGPRAPAVPRQHSHG